MVSGGRKGGEGGERNRRGSLRRGQRRGWRQWRRRGRRRGRGRWQCGRWRRAVGSGVEGEATTVAAARMAAAWTMAPSRAVAVATAAARIEYHLVWLQVEGVEYPGRVRVQGGSGRVACTCKQPKLGTAGLRHWGRHDVRCCGSYESNRAATAPHSECGAMTPRLTTWRPD